MNKTSETETKVPCVTVTTQGLQDSLGSGRATAVAIGTAAGARIQVGRRVLWNLAKVQDYLDMISE